MKRYLLAATLSGCVVQGVTDREPGEVYDRSPTIERIEENGERGTKAECVGRLTLEGKGLQTWLGAARNQIDPSAPSFKLSSLSFTWYWRRLQRGCYLHGHDFGNAPGGVTEQKDRKPQPAKSTRH